MELTVKHLLLRGTLGMGCLIICFLLLGCKGSSEGVVQGYVEAEYTYVAPEVAGSIVELGVQKGNAVKAGQLLVKLDDENELFGVKEAEGRLAQSEATLEDLKKGMRPSEIASVEAQLAQAEAVYAYSARELERNEKLILTKTVSQDTLDASRASYVENKQKVEQMKAELETARLGAREDEVLAAEAEVTALKASLEQARWTLRKKTLSSPVSGEVEDVFYRVGEWVNVGQGVVSILAPENIKIRFFVSETVRPRLTLGQVVSVAVDGKEQPIEATIVYFSTQAEYTPPVIYSKGNREKLVYMVEAKFAPQEAKTFKPGQPVDVQLFR